MPMNKLNESLTAWVLPLGQGNNIAIASHQSVAYVMDQGAFRIPGANPLFSYLTYWREQAMALCSFKLATGHHPRQSVTLEHMSVAAFRLADKVQLVAFDLESPPKQVRIEVKDTAKCFEHLMDLWGNAYMCGFESEGDPVAIVDLGRMG